MSDENESQEAEETNESTNATANEVGAQDDDMRSNVMEVIETMINDGKRPDEVEQRLDEDYPEWRTVPGLEPEATMAIQMARVSR